MTDEDKATLLSQLVGGDPVLAEMVRIMQSGMIAAAEALTADGEAVEINGVKVTPEDAKRARAELVQKYAADMRAGNWRDQS